MTNIHYPEVRKIIMDAIDRCDFKTEVSVYYAGWVADSNREISIRISVPNVKRPINIEITPGFGKNAVYPSLPDFEVWQYEKPKWYDWGSLYNRDKIELDKVLTFEDRTIINAIFKKEFDRAKTARVSEIYDKNTAHDKTISVDLIKQMDARK